MREVMLILHFTGLAMGVGTSFAMMFLGLTSSKMDKEEALKFKIRTTSIGTMGHIGLTLLVLSGGYLMTPYWSRLASSPVLITKLVLVLVLGALIGIISAMAKKAKKDNAELYLKKIDLLGKFSLVTSLAIIALAIYFFR